MNDTDGVGVSSQEQNHPSTAPLEQKAADARTREPPAGSEEAPTEIDSSAAALEDSEAIVKKWSEILGSDYQIKV